MAQHEIDLSRITENTPLRLAQAAQIAFPDGSITLSSLRREAARGRLVIWRIANKDMTTLAEVRSMIERCRVRPSLPDYGSGQAPMTETQHGSSSTADGKSAQAAARMRARKLRESLLREREASQTARRSVVGR